MDKKDLDLYGKMLYALHQSNKYKEFEPAYTVSYTHLTLPTKRIV